jgi:hypothetical protein
MTPENKKPNFFIIGAAKAGTTSLYEILLRHPNIYLPFNKEPAFFCDDTYYAHGDAWYLKTYFNKVKSQPLRGEATSRYLFFAEKVAPRILKFSAPQNPKFIAIFRDPAKLVYSFYWNSVREGFETLSFQDALAAEEHKMIEFKTKLEQTGQILYAYSRVACYAQQVQQYLELFHKNQFLFLLTDDLQNYQMTIQRLQAFLELTDFPNDLPPGKLNAAALPKSWKLHQWLRNPSTMKEIVKFFLPPSIRHRLKTALIDMNLREFHPPEMDKEIANSIRRHYGEETKKLQELIQRDLSSWLPE